MGADYVAVEVVDDGRGGPVVPGNGIIGMRERAAALEGNLDAGPRRGGGFEVVATLPVLVRLCSASCWPTTRP